MQKRKSQISATAQLKLKMTNVRTLLSEIYQAITKKRKKEKLMIPKFLMWMRTLSQLISS